MRWRGVRRSKSVVEVSEQRLCKIESVYVDGN